MKWQDLLNLFQRDTTITLADIVVALGFALVCSVVIILMYNYFYGRQNVGAGVQRSFLLMGPAITALFLGIQFSLPLSLGLLGALSIVRFRTPVKDPAEIGFVMLLIAASIGSAIFNYLLVGILFAIAIIALIGHKLARGYSGGGRGTLIITFGSPEDIVQEARLTAFIKSKLRGVKLENVSTQADSASLNYQYSRRKGIELGMFTRELSDTAAPAKVSIYIG
jgi:hypothetical protein